jgi:hypothetical protein
MQMPYNKKEIGEIKSLKYAINYTCENVGLAKASFKNFSSKDLLNLQLMLK